MTNPLWLNSWQPKLLRATPLSGCARQPFQNGGGISLPPWTRPASTASTRGSCLKPPPRKASKWHCLAWGDFGLLDPYPSFTDLPRTRNLARAFARWPALGKSLCRAALPLLKRITLPRYASLLKYGGTLSNAYLLRRFVYMLWELGQVLDPDLARQG